ncbi:MAG: hypothetical protein AB7V53_06590 [Dongiaceae bacterium]
MRPGALWLARAFGPQQAPAVAAAYRDALGPGRDAARLVLADLARYCRVGQSSFVAGDPHQTAFNEGARDVYLHVAEMIGLEPGELVTGIEAPAVDRSS